MENEKKEETAAPRAFRVIRMAESIAFPPDKKKPNLSDALNSAFASGYVPVLAGLNDGHFWAILCQVGVLSMTVAEAIVMAKTETKDPRQAELPGVSDEA